MKRVILIRENEVKERKKEKRESSRESFLNEDFAQWMPCAMLVYACSRKIFEQGTPTLALMYKLW